MFYTKGSLYLFLITVSFFSLLFNGCSRSGDSNGDQNSGGKSSVATLTSEIAPGLQCPYGGIQVDTGIDENGNGLLDLEEIDETSYVCHGVSTLTLVTAEPLGPNCAFGGDKVEVGTDTDRNGILDPDEITQTYYICDGAYAVVPTVISTNPGHGDIDIPTNQGIAATFSVPMAPSSFTDTTFSVTEDASGTPVPGTLSYNNSIAVFTPTGALPVPKLLNVTLTQGVTDSNGNPLTQDYSWSFTTSAHTSGPSVLATSPANGQSGVAISTNVNAVFNENMNAGGITPTSFTLTETIGSAPVTGTVSASLREATFVPDVSLKENTNYTATLDNTITDLSTSNPLASPYGWTFTTGTRFWQGAELVGDLITVDSHSPQVGMDSSGNAIAIWQGFNSGTEHVHSAVRKTQIGSWSASQLLSDIAWSSARDVKLAVSKNGSAYAVWSAVTAGLPYHIFRNYFNPATQAWTVPVQKTGPNNTPQYYYSHVAMNNSGAAALVYSQLYTTVAIATAQISYGGDALGGQTSLTPTAAGPFADFPKVAIDDSNRCIVVYRYNNTRIGWTRHNNTAWSAHTLFTEAGDQVNVPNIAINGAGNAVAVYTSGNSLRSQVYDVSFDTWTYTELDNNGQGVGQPRVGMDDLGNAVALWSGGSGATMGVYTKRFNGTSWDASADIIDVQTGSVLSPKLAMMPNGDAFAAWIQVDGVGEQSVFVSRYSLQAGSWGSPYLVETMTGHASELSIAVNAKGVSTVVWSHQNGGFKKIYSNRYE